MERQTLLPDMPRKSPLQKRINQLTREKRVAMARVERLVREKEEVIARAEEAERQLAELERPPTPLPKRS